MTTGRAETLWRICQHNVPFHIANWKDRHVLLPGVWVVLLFQVSEKRAERGVLHCVWGHLI